MTKQLVNKQLFAPVFKSPDTGRYIATISSTAMDRDGERISRSAYDMYVRDNKKFAAMIDHENKVFNKVGDWGNHRVEEMDGEILFVSECDFEPYLVNEKAAMIKGILDSGGILDVSIGALVDDYEEKTSSDGKTYREFTKLEIVEASFVGVGSNRDSYTRNAHNLALAKSYIQSHNEVNLMSEEYEQLRKQLQEKNDKLDDLQKKVDELQERQEETVKGMDELLAKYADLQSEHSDALSAMKKAIEEQDESAGSDEASDESSGESTKKTQSTGVTKQFYEAQSAAAAEQSDMDMYKSGKIPVVLR